MSSNWYSCAILQLITDVSTLDDDDDDDDGDCHEDLSTDHVGSLLTYENFHINGKMNLIFILYVYYNNIVDGTYWLYYTDW